MSQKTSVIFLLLCVAILCLVTAHAAERDTAAYDDAVAVLAQRGVAPTADTALTGGRGMATAVELGLLQEDGEVLPLSALGTQALQLQQEQQRAAREEAESRVRRAAYLAVYDGVQLESSTTLRARPDSSARALRTLAEGKVAKLVDITDDGWYKVSFAGSTGYVRAGRCRGVDYDDYRGTAAAMDVTASLLAYARTWIGTPYVYGGAGKGGTDCSGFTMAVFGRFGYSLSHGARSQYAAATPVSVAERKAGDLVFFSGPGESGITHVGIYLGGGQFIHASTSRNAVVIDDINGAYFSRYYYGAGRLLFE